MHVVIDINVVAVDGDVVVVSVVVAVVAVTALSKEKGEERKKNIGEWKPTRLTHF